MLSVWHDTDTQVAQVGGQPNVLQRVWAPRQEDVEQAAGGPKWRRQWRQWFQVWCQWTRLWVTCIRALMTVVVLVVVHTERVGGDASMCLHFVCLHSTHPPAAL